ncbi:hypothetical protein CBOM_01729 [Ceraceosorus bombacis]|uniref:Uncharacterized protein n=1 Tax=Ceraceosorus bombacis TaxID=401625 RepID=A0A0P1BDA3_9BASI|nr:hypothetical protein CBOM_01729 [Ceraceosorus bombacis]
MLSETITPRPRPPGGRRPSGQNGGSGSSTQALTSTADLAPENLLHVPKHSGAHSDKSDATNARIQRDLDLDLPADLTAALRRSSNATQWSLGKPPSSGATGARSREAARAPVSDPEGDAIFGKPEADLKRNGSLGRKLGAKLSKALLGDRDQKAPAVPFLPQFASAVLDGGTDDETGANVKIGATGDRWKGDGAPFSGKEQSDDDSETDMDSDWVGGLPREELEMLLMQANQVIKERERDLGVAAAIGKALLEKNISLRGKHEGLSTRLSSTVDLFALAQESADDDRPMNSPPTTNVSIDEDATPMPTPSAEYFPRMSGPPSELRSPSVQPPTTSPHLDRSPSAAALRATTSHWIPDTRGQIPSAPPSPAESRSRGHRHHTPSSASATAAQAALAHADAQRQLDLLNNQNDQLLTQLADLQKEAEEAKRAGGKRLRKLNKEIDGLRAELDSATKRNVELEGSTESRSNDRTPDTTRKSAVRRSRADLAAMLGSRASSSISPGSQRTTLQSAADTSGSRSDGPETPGHSRSSSVASSLAGELGNLPSQSPGERALVAQLLSKIKELEETNAALAEAGTDMDGRLGKALQEGERIRDAYEAVEAGSSFGGDDSFSSTVSPGRDMPRSLSGLNPASLSRRAAGNRHIIEGRRTIRAALKKEAVLNRINLDASDGTYELRLPRSGTASSLSTCTSASSSAASSPRTSRRARLTVHGLMKPKIFVTPSMEDLAARRQEDAERAEERLQAGRPSLAPTLQFPVSRPFPTSKRALRSVSSVASMAESDVSPVESPTQRRGESVRGLPRSESGASQTESMYQGAKRTFPSSASDFGEGRPESRLFVHSLESELGSVLGDADERGDFSLSDDRSTLTPSQAWEVAIRTPERRGEGGQDGDMQLSDLGNALPKRLSPAERYAHLRPTASVGSLRGAMAASEAASDIADLRWSVNSAATVVPGPSVPRAIEGATAKQSKADLDDDGFGAVDPFAATELDAELFRQLSSAGDGEWPAPGDDDLIPRGALRDQVMTNVESYDLLERATKQRPVHWADDDDFGQAITEREARRLGLLAAAKKTRRSLLGWVSSSSPKSGRQSAGSSKRNSAILASSPMHPSGSHGSLLEIESADQVQEREELTALLRQRRVDGLKARVQAGQISASKAISLGLDHADATEAEERSLEVEATKRAFALSPARHRRASRAYASAASSARESPASSSSLVSIKGKGKLPLCDHASFSPARPRRRDVGGGGGKEKEADCNSSDEQFEMLDLDPRRKAKPPKRGTDFYPVDLKARYRPAMVKQRVQVASNDAVTWATAWTSFSLMILFAFIVTFARGPKRVLGPQPPNARR